LEALPLRRGRRRCRGRRGGGRRRAGGRLDVALAQLLGHEFVVLVTGLRRAAEVLGLRLTAAAAAAERDREAAAMQLDVPELVGPGVAVLERPHDGLPFWRPGAVVGRDAGVQWRGPAPSPSTRRDCKSSPPGGTRGNVGLAKGR